MNETTSVSDGVMTWVEYNDLNKEWLVREWETGTVLFATADEKEARTKADQYMEPPDVSPPGP